MVALKLCTFIDPLLHESVPSSEFLREIILNPPAMYWQQGNGGATLEFGSSRKQALLILPNDAWGFYLQYVDENKECWLSLSDRNKLKVVAECSDEWYASIGLFLPKEIAWLAIEDFFLTGGRSNRIQWITPKDIPPEGNC